MTYISNPLNVMSGEPELIENITTSGTSAESASALENGSTYSITASKSVYFKIAATGADAASSSNAILLVTGQRLFFTMHTASQYIQVVQESEAGVFSIAKHTLA